MTHPLDRQSSPALLALLILAYMHHDRGIRASQIIHRQAVHQGLPPTPTLKRQHRH